MTRPLRVGFYQRWKALLAQLRRAYEQGDVSSLRTLWYQALREPGVGWALRVFNRIYPLQGVLDIAEELDKRMAEHGLAQASRWLLDEHVVHWRSELPAETRVVLSQEPVVIYGNHPSFLTLFLVAAHVDRPDFRVVAASFLERFLPSFAPYAFPVELPVSDWWKQLWEGGLQRLIVVYWVSRLRPLPSRARAKELNRHALAQSVENVKRGGALLIAPQGWSRSSRHWYPGLGVILKGLVAQPSERPVYLVAYREENTSDRLVRRLVEGRAERQKAWEELEKRPATIRFAPPRLLDPALIREGTAAEVSERLRVQYLELFADKRSLARTR